jgi:hypothetical protein
MPGVGIEPTIPGFERAKTVHASDRAATVIGSKIYTKGKANSFSCRAPKMDRKGLWTIELFTLNLFPLDGLPFQTAIVVSNTKKYT